MKSDVTFFEEILLFPKDCFKVNKEIAMHTKKIIIKVKNDAILSE